ncbi:hypothetical protein [Maridesulfovibrio bastinii]|jgi:hypothetical protein|uniref:hypothetical protein n=1 Tax=Maridesulfovibrio bastinii TaxID=47157 RepID=UPI000429A892|nr:hypothetical protein [Maridesulfovibrio bastinii]
MEITGIDSSVSTTTASDKQTFGAQVVTKTLDYMNSDSGNSGSTNSDYDFQKSVLGSHYSGLGAIADTKA